MATPSVGFRVDAREVSRFALTVRLWASDQLPFAAAAALTDTAKDATAELKERFGSHFQLRNRGLLNAVTYQPASKRDTPPTAYVGVRPWAEFLVLHVTGGAQKGKAGRVAVPTRIVRRGATGRVPKRQLPRTLRDAKGFVASELEQRERIVVRRRGAAGRVGIFFHLVSSAKIRQRWPFEREVIDTARAKLPGHFARRAEQALRPR